MTGSEDMTISPHTYVSLQKGSVTGLNGRQDIQLKTLVIATLSVTIWVG